MGRNRHILVDTFLPAEASAEAGGLILKAAVHSAGVQHRDGAALVFDQLAQRFPFIEKIYGDGGHQGPTVQNASPRPMEIVKRNQSGFEALPKRWIVERTFVWLGINRCLAKDCERFAQTSLAFIQTAMIKLMARRLARFGYS
ncbi:MAG: transposase [Kiloniellales bacterium]